MKAPELWKEVFGEAHPPGEDGPWNPEWVHPPSLDSYRGVSDWLAPDFYYSKQLGWTATAIVGMIADFALTYLQGDILEIGVGISSIFLTGLAKKFKRKLYQCDVEAGKILNPLTVPGYLSEDSKFYCMASDDMFAKKEITPLAFAFIDGDHNYAQVKKDFWNMVPLMVDNGYIMLHDTYPPTEDYVDPQMCGDVYKLRQELENDKRFDCITLVGYGSYIACTLIRVKPVNRPYYQE